MNKFIKMEEIEEILQDRERIESDKEEVIKLRAELNEINNNMNSYSENERFIYDERRNIIINDINRIEEEEKLKKKLIETKIKNIRRDI